MAGVRKKLFQEPPAFELPLSKGNDLLVKCVYKPLVVDEFGAPVLDVNGKKQFAVAPYPMGATVTMEIDSIPQGVFVASISESEAIVFGDHLLVDDTKNGTLWRIILTYQNNVNKVMCNGIVIRADGK
jgi:hypothetical protein